MGSVWVDGQEVEVRDGERINGIQAASRAGIDIPHYCWHPGLSVVASCRMCLVETGRRNPATGQVAMVGKLVPACQTPAVDGTVFVTNSELVTAARARVEEDLLLRHPIDCPICDKSGECRLQDYHFQHGQPERRADLQPFTSRRRAVGDTVTLFVDRCVMCTRCIRFCREVAETSELLVTQRGVHQEIDVVPGFPLANPLAGNVVDLCPVGALTDRDFLYRQRVWFMRSHPHVCAGCATGCSIVVQENQDQIYRLIPRENLHVNQWWMCDAGRYGWKYVFDPQRLVEPRVRRGGEWVRVEWEEAIRGLDAALRPVQRLAVILSPFLTVEEAYLLATYARQVQPQATLVVGPVPRQGEDQSFAGGFAIAAEKSPNRRGVTEVIAARTAHALSWDAWQAEQAADGPWDAVWWAGGYAPPGPDPGALSALARARLVIVQDLFASPLAERADWQLPATAFAERGGSYVNRHDRLQSFDWAIRPPQGVMREGQLYWRLLGRTGLYPPRAVLAEVAGAIAFFAAAGDAVPAEGIALRAAPPPPAPGQPEEARTS